MKNRRFDYGYRKTASKLHRAVGDCIRNSVILSGFSVYQEYPVNRVNPNYPSAREKFDWVLASIKIVIECHGAQHYHPVAFGGKNDNEVERFKAQVIRDEAKKQAALRMGYSYVIVPYTDQDKITEKYLLDLIKANPSTEVTEVIEKQKVDFKSAYQNKKKSDEESGRAEANRAKARELAKDKYQKQKAWKKAQGGQYEDK